MRHGAAWALLAAAACGGPTEPWSAEPAVQPDRVISFAPHLTEVMFALGLGDRVVGVTRFCDRPAEAALLPRVGDAFSPEAETVVALAPDVALLSGSMTGLGAQIRRLGIDTLGLPSETIDDLHATIETLGRVFRIEEHAAALSGRIRSDLEAVRASAGGGDGEPVPCVLILERRPGRLQNMTAVGGNNVIDELLTLAGGRNMLADLPSPYPKVTLEDLVRADPAVILDFSVHAFGSGDEEAARATWAAAGPVRAVRDGHVMIMPPDLDMFPGPRIGDTARVLGRALHGDAR